MLALAFGESLAFISLLLPATVILLGVGLLIGGSGIAFWPLWCAAVVGAVLGDWLSFWIGRRLKNNVANYRPASRHPDLLPRGHRLFERWGGAGVFFGRFLGPLRASVPLVAGICEMPTRGVSGREHRFSYRVGDRHPVPACSASSGCRSGWDTLQERTEKERSCQRSHCTTPRLPL